MAILFLLVASFCILNTQASIKIKPGILGPPLANRPFVIGWNVASENCKRFGIDIDLKDFDIIHNPDKSWQGSALTIFYSEQLGLYPYFDEDGKAFNGGLPQYANLKAHLEKAAKDIQKFIPDENFRGLAVIDWESWKPLFARSTWGPFKIYHQKSLEKVITEHPDWTHEQQFARAKIEYETSAQMIFDFTLALGKTMRPKALWGFYLFPDCYNYDKTGERLNCSSQVQQMNDEIEWVFDHSTALYPSVYLGEWFKNKKYAVDFVKNRILETRRVDDRRPGNISIPIFAYHSITYRKVPDFINLLDLRDSIGVAAALGASGMVIWGDHFVANNSTRCQTLGNYVNNTFGPFCKAISDAAAACSQEYCNGQGRCVISIPSQGKLENGIVITKERYLNGQEALELVRYVGNESYKLFDRHFLERPNMSKKYSMTCQCFTGWTGKFCNVIKQ